MNFGSGALKIIEGLMPEMKAGAEAFATEFGERTVIKEGAFIPPKLGTPEDHLQVFTSLFHKDQELQLYASGMMPYEYVAPMIQEVADTPIATWLSNGSMTIGDMQKLTAVGSAAVQGRIKKIREELIPVLMERRANEQLPEQLTAQRNALLEQLGQIKSSPMMPEVGQTTTPVLKQRIAILKEIDDIEGKLDLMNAVTKTEFTDVEKNLFGELAQLQVTAAAINAKFRTIKQLATVDFVANTVETITGGELKVKDPLYIVRPNEGISGTQWPQFGNLKPQAEIANQTARLEDVVDAAAKRHPNFKSPVDVEEAGTGVFRPLVEYEARYADEVMARAEQILYQVKAERLTPEGKLVQLAKVEKSPPVSGKSARPPFKELLPDFGPREVDLAKLELEVDANVESMLWLEAVTKAEREVKDEWRTKFGDMAFHYNDEIPVDQLTEVELKSKRLENKAKNALLNPLDGEYNFTVAPEAIANYRAYVYAPNPRWSPTSNRAKLAATLAEIREDRLKAAGWILADTRKDGTKLYLNPSMLPTDRSANLRALPGTLPEGIGPRIVDYAAPLRMAEAMNQVAVALKDENIDALSTAMALMTRVYTDYPGTLQYQYKDMLVAGYQKLKELQRSGKAFQLPGSSKVFDDVVNELETTMTAADATTELVTNARLFSTLGLDVTQAIQDANGNVSEIVTVVGNQLGGVSSADIEVLGKLLSSEVIPTTFRKTTEAVDRLASVRPKSRSIIDFDPKVYVDLLIDDLDDRPLALIKSLPEKEAPIGKQILDLTNQLREMDRKSAGFKVMREQLDTLFVDLFRTIDDSPIVIKAKKFSEQTTMDVLNGIEPTYENRSSSAAIAEAISKAHAAHQDVITIQNRKGRANNIASSVQTAVAQIKRIAELAFVFENANAGSSATKLKAALLDARNNVELRHAIDLEKMLADGKLDIDFLDEIHEKNQVMLINAYAKTMTAGDLKLLNKIEADLAAMKKPSELLAEIESLNHDLDILLAERPDIMLPEFKDLAHVGSRNDILTQNPMALTDLDGYIHQRFMKLVFDPMMTSRQQVRFKMLTRAPDGTVSDVPRMFDSEAELKEYIFRNLSKKEQATIKKPSQIKLTTEALDKETVVRYGTQVFHRVTSTTKAGSPSSRAVLDALALDEKVVNLRGKDVVENSPVTVTAAMNVRVGNQTLLDWLSTNYLEPLGYRVHAIVPRADGSGIPVFDGQALREVLKPLGEEITASNLAKSIRNLTIPFPELAAEIAKNPKYYLAIMSNPRVADEAAAQVVKNSPSNIADVFFPSGVGSSQTAVQHFAVITNKTPEARRHNTFYAGDLNSIISLVSGSRGVRTGVGGTANAQSIAEVSGIWEEVDQRIAAKLKAGTLLPAGIEIDILEEMRMARTVAAKHYENELVTAGALTDQKTKAVISDIVITGKGTGNESVRLPGGATRRTGVTRELENLKARNPLAYQLGTMLTGPQREILQLSGGPETKISMLVDTITEFLQDMPPAKLQSSVKSKVPTPKLTPEQRSINRELARDARIRAVGKLTYMPETAADKFEAAADLISPEIASGNILAQHRADKLIAQIKGEAIPVFGGTGETRFRLVSAEKPLPLLDKLSPTDKQNAILEIERAARTGKLHSLQQAAGKTLYDNLLATEELYLDGLIRSRNSYMARANEPDIAEIIATLNENPMVKLYDIDTETANKYAMQYPDPTSRQAALLRDRKELIETQKRAIALGATPDPYMLYKASRMKAEADVAYRDAKEAARVANIKGDK